jgi:hypothetical protein
MKAQKIINEVSKESTYNKPRSFWKKMYKNLDRELKKEFGK